MIQAYVGLPGTGKTLAMTYDAIPIIQSGGRVISNYPVRWDDTSFFGKKTTHFKSTFLNPVDFMLALSTEYNTTFLFDEANIGLSAYSDLKKVDHGLLNRFAQNRKVNSNFFFTSQRFHHSLKRLRDLTNAVIKCQKISIFGIVFFRHIYYDPTIFDREQLFDTPLEQKYILKKRFLMPWQLKAIYKKYDTMYLIESSEEYRDRILRERTKQALNVSPPEVII